MIPASTVTGSTQIGVLRCEGPHRAGRGQLFATCGAAARRSARRGMTGRRLLAGSRDRNGTARDQSPRPLAIMATPGSGMIDGLAPFDDGIDSGVTRAGKGDIGGGMGVVGFMPGMGGQTPSIMYDLALIGCSLGASRRH